MAVAWVSPGDPHAIGPVAKRSQYELGADAPGARHPDHPKIGRVLKPADPGQVRCAITAPMTKKSSNLGFPFFHSHLLLTAMRLALRLAPLPGFHSSHRAPCAVRRAPLPYISLIMAMIWPSSKPFKFKAPDRHDATQRPHPLHRTGFTSALPANGPFWIKEGAE
jgi:hypothetical protein